MLEREGETDAAPRPGEPCCQKQKARPRNPFLTQLWFYQGGLVAVGTHKGYVQIWDAAGGRKLTTLEGHSARVGQSHLLWLEMTQFQF